jgi:predicted O-methyltransferase YrrM
VIPTLPGPFDLAFFDASKPKSDLQLSLLLPKLTDDALVLADNVLSHPKDMEPYLALIASQPAFDHTIVPVGKGLSMAYRRATR